MTTAYKELLPQQGEALACTAKNVLVTGGLGAGKTAIGVHFVIKMVTQYPDVRGLITANSFKQLNEATLTALETELVKLGFVKGVNYTRIEGKFTIGGVDIVTHSLEAYEKLDGMEFGWALVDEAAKAKEEAYRTVKERVRQKDGPCQIMLTTTTNGFNWLYDRFVTNADNNHVTFKLRTKENFFLPEDYYSDLVEQYGGEDTPLARQQLFGEFVNLTAGQVYNYFDDKHLKPVKRWGSKLYIGLDFNIGNMNAVVCEADAYGLRVIEEITLKGNAGTNEMALALKEKYGTSNLEIIAKTLTDIEVPFNDAGKEFINTILNVTDKYEDGFPLYCHLWISAKYSHPREILKKIKNTKKKWLNEPFLSRAVTSILPRIISYKKDSFLSNIKYQMTYGFSDSSSVALNLSNISKFEKLPNRLRAYLLPVEAQKIYPLPKFLIALTVLDSKIDTAKFKEELLERITDPFYRHWIINF